MNTNGCTTFFDPLITGLTPHLFLWFLLQNLIFYLNTENYIKALDGKEIGEGLTDLSG